MEKKTIAVLSGDGVGPEVMAATLPVLERVGEIFGRSFTFKPALVGGAAFDEYGEHLPQDTIDVCRRSDAILFGSVGGPLADSDLPKWRGCETRSILALRKAFALAANFRPAKVYAQLEAISPLRRELIQQGVDLLIIRELQGDVYFGEHTLREQEGRRIARDTCEYNEDQISLVAEVAFQAARKRRSRVTSVDKANVLHTSKLWRDVVRETHKSFSDVDLEDMLVDNCALQLVKDPSRFDVIVTSNLFGDILSDLAAALPGSLGLMPSASLNAQGFGLFEPSGGSAPDIAGKGIANPIAQILSASMMVRFAFGWSDEADALDRAVVQVLEDGVRTTDIFSGEGRCVSTTEMAFEISRRLSKKGGGV
jgi:3-isopropylmalate dehydrogenase